VTDLAALAAGYARLKQGTLWHSTGRCKGYADQNPGEAAKLDAYVAAIVAGGSPVMPVLATATGDGLARMIAAGSMPGTPPPPPPPPPPPSDRWFGGPGVSPFNTAIGVGAVALPNSAAWLAPLAGLPINYNRGAYTTSVWTVDGSTPRTLWKLIDSWFVDNVPTRTDLVFTQDPAAATEWYAVFDDAAHNILWSSLSPKFGYAVAGYWGAYNLFPFRRDGSGFCRYTDYGAGRAAGASQGGGMIRRAEIAAGVIEHAVGCALPAVGSSVAGPARYSDGGGGSSAIPMGSLIQFDPAVDVATLAWAQPVDKIVLRAMQTYGLYVLDSSSNPSFYAQQYNIGDGAGALFTPGQMPANVWASCRVVASPCPSPPLDDLTTFGQPHH
jgi:hypothetical protein